MTHRITHAVGRPGRKRCRRSYKAYASSRWRFLHEKSPRKSGRVSAKKYIFLETVKFFNVYTLSSKPFRNYSCVFSDGLWHTICILETAWKVPGNSGEKSTFHEKSEVFQFCPRSWQTSIITPGYSPTFYDTVYTFQNCASPLDHSWSIEIHKVKKACKT